MATLQSFLRLIGFIIPAAASAAAIVVSIPEQRLYVFDDSGEKTASYPVSTSAYGLGDTRGTYSTPLGKLEVAGKIGDGAPIGAVFKSGHRTGEICKINSPGRDPIITRILHLRGLESQNASAYTRCIYIHGTPDERRIGKPVSYGCVRMRSSDLVQLFDMTSVGTSVEIVNARVGKLFAKTTWNVPLPAVASAPPAEKQTASSEKSTTLTRTEPPRMALASKLHPAPRPLQISPETRTPAGAMTIFEMPGMSFKFGPASRDDSR